MTLNLTLPRDATTLAGPIPRTLAEFREWVERPELEKVRTDFYRGEVWIDMSLEQYDSHAVVKSIIGAVLITFIERERLGRYTVNGVRVTNEDIDLSAKPDGVFVSFESFTTGRVVRVEAASGEGVNELVGTPDMVLEVVSPSTVRKDKVTLRKAYSEAGIPEYWLVDARGPEVAFDILKRGPKGYTETRKAGGWVKSAVFGRAFKLTAEAGPDGHPVFTLAVK